MSSGVQTMTKWTIRSSLPCKHGTSFVHGLLHLTVFSSSIVKIKILAIFLSNIRKTLKKKKKEYMCPQPNQGRNLGEANQIIAPRPWLGEPDPASGWARGPLGTWHWDSHSIPFQGHKAWAVVPHSIWVPVPLGSRPWHNWFVFPQRKVLPGSQKGELMFPLS